MGKKIVSVVLAALLASANICCAQETEAGKRYTSVNISDLCTHTFTVLNTESGSTEVKSAATLYDGKTGSGDVYSTRDKQTFESYEIEMPEVKSVDKVRIHINAGRDWLDGERSTAVTLKDENGTEIKTVTNVLEETGYIWAEYDFGGAYGKKLSFSQTNSKNILCIDETEVCDAGMVSVPFEKNADSIVSLDKTDENGVSYAEISGDVPFMDNLPTNYFSGQFGAHDSSYFGTDGSITVKRKYRESDSATSVITSATEYVKIPVNYEECATGVADAFMLRTPKDGEAGGKISLTADLKQLPTKKLYVLAAHATAATVQAVIAYDDNTTDTVSVSGNAAAQLKTGNYPVFGDESKAKIYGTYSRGYTLIYPYSYSAALVKTENTVSRDGSGTSAKNHTIGEILYEITPDPTKIPVSVTLTNTNNVNYPTLIYSIMQQGAAVSEMMETVKAAENLENGMWTEEDIRLIDKANAYADILEGKYAYDFSAVRALKAAAEKQRDLVGIKNIDFEKNADTLITPVDGKAEINPDTWFAGLLDNYSGGFFEGGFTGGDMSVYNGKISDGCITVNERVHDEVSNAKTESFAGARQYKIPVNALNDGENDSFIISTSIPYGKTSAPESVTASLKQIPSSSVYLLTNRRGSVAFRASVAYADGTTDDYTIKSAQSGNAGGYDMYEHVKINEDGSVERNVTNMTSRAVGTLSMGYASYKTDKMTDGTRDSEASQIGNSTRNLILSEIKLNAGKVPVSVKVYNTEIYPVAIYSIAQETLGAEAMKAALEETRSLSFTDEDFAAKAAMAANYRQVLAECGIINIKDYGFVDKFKVLLNAEKNVYADLSEYADTDLITVKNAPLPSNGRTVPESQQNTDHNYNVYYNGNAIPDDGIISMNAPTNSKFAQVNGAAAGQMYKLSGAYKGEGNDAVKVLPGAEKEITFGGAEGYAKTLSFMLDTVYAGETPNPGGENITSESDMYGYINVPVKLSYTDGTAETKYAMAYLATGYYHSQVYAWAGSYGRIFFDGTKMQESSKNSTQMFASNVESNAAKKLEKITFINNTEKEYHILAITSCVYTNAELAAADTTNIDAATAKTPITFANAKTFVSEAKVVLEKARRGIGAEISQTRLEEVESVLKKAADFESETFGRLFAKTVINKENKTAAATLANTTISDEYYSVIAAVYDNGKLVEAKCSPCKVLRKGACDITETVNLETEFADNYEYKIFIWNAADKLKPLETSVYPY